MRLKVPSFLGTAGGSCGSVPNVFAGGPAEGQRPRRSFYGSHRGTRHADEHSAGRPSSEASARSPTPTLRPISAAPLARVTVEQQFQNTSSQKIESRLRVSPAKATQRWTNMTMHIGDRTVRGKIKPKEEARAIYEAAKNAGHLAGLLDQERPNIFHSGCGEHSARREREDRNPLCGVRKIRSGQLRILVPHGRWSSLYATRHAERHSH